MSALQDLWHKLFPVNPWPGDDDTAAQIIQGEVFLLREGVGPGAGGNIRPRAELERIAELLSLASVESDATYGDPILHAWATLVWVMCLDCDRLAVFNRMVANAQAFLEHCGYDTREMTP